MSNLSYSTITDFSMLVIANLVNLLLAAMFLLRVQKRDKAAHFTGGIATALGLPVSAIVVLHIIWQREWWAIVLPSIYILFCLVEFLLDFALKIDFRSSSLLWPYLLIYYLALIALIGYSFAAAKLYGFITLGTYFINLFTTAYSYSKVGHGRRTSHQ